MKIKTLLLGTMVAFFGTSVAPNHDPPSFAFDLAGVHAATATDNTMLLTSVAHTALLSSTDYNEDAMSCNMESVFVQLSFVEQKSVSNNVALILARASKLIGDIKTNLDTLAGRLSDSVSSVERRSFA